MRLKPIAAAFAGIAAVCAFALTQNGELKPGVDAPSFAGKGVDGKDYSLKSLTKDKPVFVLFWKERCPHNARAAALFNSLSKAYEGKAQLVSIVSAPQDRLDAWAKQFAINHPLIADADKTVIGAFGLAKSIGTYQIGKDGKIVKLFPGYGQNELNELNLAMAAAAGIEPAKVDLTGAPGRLTWG